MTFYCIISDNMSYDLLNNEALVAWFAHNIERVHPGGNIVWCRLFVCFTSGLFTLTLFSKRNLQWSCYFINNLTVVFTEIKTHKNVQSWIVHFISTNTIKLETVLLIWFNNKSKYYVCKVVIDVWLQLILHNIPRWIVCIYLYIPCST